MHVEKHAQSSPAVPAIPAQAPDVRMEKLFWTFQSQQTQMEEEPRNHQHTASTEAPDTQAQLNTAIPVIQTLEPSQLILHSWSKHDLSLL